MRACDVDTVVMKNGVLFLSLMYTNRRFRLRTIFWLTIEVDRSRTTPKTTIPCLIFMQNTCVFVLFI